MLQVTLVVASCISAQVLKIFGIFTSKNPRGEEKVALPFGYALLTSKGTTKYATVLQAIKSKASVYGIANCVEVFPLRLFWLAFSILAKSYKVIFN